MNYMMRLFDVLILLNADKLVIDGYKNPYIILDGRKITLMRGDIKNGESKKLINYYIDKYKKNGIINHEGKKIRVSKKNDTLEFILL